MASDDIPLRSFQNVSLEEDEYGYVDAKEGGISKEAIEQLPSRHINLLDADATLESKSDPNLRRRTLQLKNAALTTRQVSADVDNIYELLNSDPNSTVENKLKTLREMHQSLTIKRQVKELLDADLKKLRADEFLGGLTRLKLRTQTVWQKFLYELKNMSYALEPWHSSIKSVQGQFGSGVASYFIFLRWLVYLNVSNFALILFFLVVPQHLFDFSDSHRANKTDEAFSGYDLLTGSGSLTDTSLYFGHYTNQVIGSSLYYNMPLAYLFIIALTSIINLLAVSMSLTSSYQKNYVDTKSDVKHQFCNKLFCAWDFSIETEDAAKLRKIAFCNEIKELLFSIRRDQKEKTWSQKIVQITLRILINACCLGIMAAICYAIYYLLEKKALKVQVRILEDMTLALLVTFVSTTFYFLLKYCTKLEFYFTRKQRLRYTMIRTVLLRTAMIAIIVYFWVISNVPDEVIRPRPCYETELGKEIYRLVWVNFFVAVIFFTIFGEFFRKLLVSRLFTTRLKLAQFDIGFNTLDLIYYQTLIWLGTFCMPLAPLINIIILVLLFYVKLHSVSSNCRPPKRTWSVNEAQTFFLILMFIMFLLTSFAVGYVLFAIDPSPCGPFKDYEKTSDIFTELFFEKDKEYEANEVIKYLSSPGVMFACFCALCVVVYNMRAEVKAHISLVKITREQLIMEGKDKVYLLKLFDAALAIHLQKNGNGSEPKDTPPRDPPNSSACQDVLINEGYSDYYNVPINQPLSKNLEPGYIPANVPVNKQPYNPSDKNFRNSPRTPDFITRSPMSPVGDCDSPLRKAKGIHIPPHQPGFRHFFHEDSPKISRNDRDTHDKYL